MRYGLTTHSFIASTAATATTIVTTQSMIVGHGCGSPAVRRSTGPLMTKTSRGFARVAKSRSGRGRRTTARPEPANPRRPRVLRKLEPACEGVGEALEFAAVLPKSARKPACDGIEDDHRGELAPGEYVGPDRDRVGSDMLENPLVEALEARRHDRERVLGRQLLHQVLVELPSLRSQRDDAAPRVIAVDSLERGAHDVDAEHHSCSAPVGLVVDLADWKRREVAVAPEAQLQLRAEHRGDGSLLREPRERMRTPCEEVDLNF